MGEGKRGHGDRIGKSLVGEGRVKKDDRGKDYWGSCHVPELLRNRQVTEIFKKIF